MTLPEILTEICTAQEAASLAGATDDQVQALRTEIINSHRKEATGQEYQHAWVVPAETAPEQRRLPLNPGRTTERGGDRF